MDNLTLFEPPPAIPMRNATGLPVTAVPCPHCGAQRGDLCITPGGDYAASVHRDRLRELLRIGDRS